MPEMNFRLRWPDGREMDCYSPSLVVREHLAAGTSYPLPEFMRRTREALQIASERVRARYGHPCSLALGQLAALEAAARTFDTATRVQVLAFDPPE